MGLSISIASAVVLIGWIVFVGAVSTAMLRTMNEVGLQVNSSTNDTLRLSVQLRLSITDIENRTVNFTVSNTGSKEIFLRNDTFAWNTAILTYNNTDWKTYTIENYTVLRINATGTNETFDLSTHRTIKPGEQALINIQLPTSAPDILTNSVVTVVFATHYGISARQEVFVNQYGERILIAGLGNLGLGLDGIAWGYVS
jgi:archaellum component FlaF (FlaF/FlaG flagellin family)